MDLIIIKHLHVQCAAADNILWNRINDITFNSYKLTDFMWDRDISKSYHFWYSLTQDRHNNGSKAVKNERKYFL